MIRATWSDLMEFNNYNISSVSRRRGLYRLSHKSPSDGKYYVFYIGKAEDLQERLSSHLRDTEPNLCVKKMVTNYQCAFRVTVLDNYANIDGAEAFLIDYFKPTCNENIPQVQREEINIDNQ